MESVLLKIIEVIDMKTPSPLLQEEGPLYLPSLLALPARKLIGTLQIKYYFWSANIGFYEVKW